MNYWIIIGTAGLLIGGLWDSSPSLIGAKIVVMIIFGACNLIGIWWDQVKESEQDRPILKVMSAQPINNDGLVSLLFTNHGKQPAINPTLVFTEHPMRDMGKGARISWSEMPNGQQSRGTLDLFLGMRPPTKLPPAILDVINDFRSGKSTITAQFYLEYNDAKTTYVSPSYWLLCHTGGLCVVHETSDQG